MYPFLASEDEAGFVINSLLRDTPFAAIWKRAVWGQVADDVSRRLEQVVYSEDPSATE